MLTSRPSLAATDRGLGALSMPQLSPASPEAPTAPPKPETKPNERPATPHTPPAPNKQPLPLPDKAPSRCPMPGC